MNISGSRGSHTILFLDYHPGYTDSERKLAGIVRFSRVQGWKAVAIPFTASKASDVKPLLEKFHPLGCIVERASWDEYLPKRLFGKIPVAYLDPQDPSLLPSSHTVPVVCDNAAVARMAFRELSAGMPSCLGIVPSPGLPRWNFIRIKEFKAQCVDAGIECRVFAGIVNEDREKRLLRLAAWIRELPKRSGIFGTNDNAARDVAEAAVLIPRHIPRELSVLGVDGGAEGSFPVPVSSIKLDLELAGYLAAKSLKKAIERNAAGKESGQQQLSFGPLLVLRRRSTQGAGRREPHILEAVDMIRREACNGLTAAALAARFPVSRKHFERRFREAMGRSILDEIIHVRFQAVFDLLSRPVPPISAIADFCGFPSDRELRKLFRHRTGITMRQWRNRHLH